MFVYPLDAALNHIRTHTPPNTHTPSHTHTTLTLQALTEVSLFQRERLAQQLAQRQGYLTRLLSVFRVGGLGCVGA